MTTTSTTPTTAPTTSEVDLLARTAATRAQYDKGLLTFDEFVAAILTDRNTYCDDPASGTLIVTLADDDDDDTLGPCGCTDYHMADCPTRDSYHSDDRDDYDCDPDTY